MLLLGAAIGASALWFVQQDRSNSDATERAELATTTLDAETRDLTSYSEWAATLQSGTAGTVSATARGTVTANSDAGERIELGNTIANIDGKPVVALYGSVPQFRELAVGIDDGADIRQLEENLVALGYDPGETVTVDEIYTTSTGDMVERWETDLGIEDPDNVVSAGQVAFVSGPSEITSRTTVGSQVSPGQSLATTVTLAESGFLILPAAVVSLTELVEPGTVLLDGDAIGQAELDGATVPLIAVTSSPDLARTDAIEMRIPTGANVAEVVLADPSWIEAGQPVYRWEASQGSIELEVDVDESNAFPVGLAVEVQLPDGQLVPAIVDTVDDVARTIQDGGNTITVVDVSIQPTESVDSTFTSGPVTVRVEDDAILGATVIPVRALVALAEGGHAVDVEGRGLIAVELGAFDDGWVEVLNGSIEPGESLVAPT